MQYRPQILPFRKLESSLWRDGEGQRSKDFEQSERVGAIHESPLQVFLYRMSPYGGPRGPWVKDAFEQYTKKFQSVRRPEGALGIAVVVNYKCSEGFSPYGGPRGPWESVVRLRWQHDYVSVRTEARGGLGPRTDN